MFSFAQFTRHAGQQVLEVGVGAGADFLQWVRAGVYAHGIDLTNEAILNVQKRLLVYGLAAADLCIGDSELPSPDNTFDLVYSWGVIHHAPDTKQSLREIARVLRPGGIAKVMVYNRHSLQALYCRLRYALLRGRPWQSISHVLYFHMESVGTKAYTRTEFVVMASECGFTIDEIDTAASPFYDLLERYALPTRIGAKILACILGRNKCGWFLGAVMTKP
ncbi:class I SAM-dependent methyltransferase [Tardiphaga sp.]|uniref:class I SAM-dependent methyltransferase n=1 Tax=Tardiphaga sp. TaxID=1926292 RepID=UPI00261949F0|nr:class I SAM-dependent methyltransferase [Tardiphaga sp.]